ncbi:hypothetical protein ACFWOL_33905 [Streptomyces sp. NPDC058442]|uniref:hypothetical protein n=1 Tax=Streptomyces sp. NPDC058442 TaxID=3346503 RepID=UPI00364FF3D6
MTIEGEGFSMAMCPVCGAELPARRGPRARRYCSRACQAKAYRARQRQRDAHRLAVGDEQSLLAQYDGVAALELADQLALAARRLAGALSAGRHADDFDLGVLARIPAVLAARAAQAPHGIPNRQAAHPSPAVTGPTTRAPAARRDRPAAPAAEPAGWPAATGTQTARDDSGRSTSKARPTARATQAARDDSAVTATPQGIAARPQKLAPKKARAFVDAAELVRHPEHRENHQWILRSGDTIIGSVEPTYGGTSRSGRNGWTGRLGGSPGRRCRTRDEAAVDLAARWIRTVTTAPRRTLTGDS